MREAQLHKQVADFLNATLIPPTWWTTFPADSASRRGRIGLKLGVPDILLIHCGQAYWIELKSDSGVPSKDQRVTIPLLFAAGSPPKVCRSLDEVIAWLRLCGIPLRPHTLAA